MELVNVIAAERGTYVQPTRGGRSEIVLAWLHIVDTHDDHFVLAATAKDMTILNTESIEVVAKTVRERMGTHVISTAANR